MVALERILIATDFSGPSDVALTYGRELAKTFSSTLHVVHVADDLSVSPLPGMQAFAEAVKGGRSQAALNERVQAQLDAIVAAENSPHVKGVLLTSHTAAEAIVTYAGEMNADLIIVGTRGRSGVGQVVLGSVAQRVVRSAGCPVLVVREKEHEFVRPDSD